MKDAEVPGVYKEHVRLCAVAEVICVVGSGVLQGCLITRSAGFARVAEGGETCEPEGRLDGRSGGQRCGWGELLDELRGGRRCITAV